MILLNDSQIKINFDNNLELRKIPWFFSFLNLIGWTFLLLLIVDLKIFNTISIN